MDSEREEYTVKPGDVPLIEARIVLDEAFPQLQRIDNGNDSGRPNRPIGEGDGSAK